MQLSQRHQHPELCEGLIHTESKPRSWMYDTFLRIPSESSSTANHPNHKDWQLLNRRMKVRQPAAHQYAPSSHMPPQHWSVANLSVSSWKTVLDLHSETFAPRALPHSSDTTTTSHTSAQRYWVTVDLWISMGWVFIL